MNGLTVRKRYHTNDPASHFGRSTPHPDPTVSLGPFMDGVLQDSLQRFSFEVGPFLQYLLPKIPSGFH